jgi:hypothetical protein
MEGQGHIPNGIPPFDGKNYVYLINITQTYLTSLGVDIWISFFNGYKVPKTTPTDPDENKSMRCNAKAGHVIIGRLTPNIASKVMSYNSAK